jgi:hypothetical protein
MVKYREEAISKTLMNQCPRPMIIVQNIIARRIATVTGMARVMFTAFLPAQVF